MTSGISLGTSTDKWQMWQQEQMNATKAKMNKSGYVSKTDNSNNTQQVQVTKTSENTCTDGNDDGKIGFFAAAGHAIKGAAKGLWNGIKGCFTNSEGKFSLGKTLLTVGMGALCIAFPAVGLVACGIGAVSGAVTLGKGIYNAATAETDAQAKDAWENIGDGAFTVVTSAAGAKASFKAVKATSTAAVDDVAKAASKAIEKGDDVTNVLKNLDNADDVANALKNLDNADDVAKTVSKLGKMDDASAWGNLAEDATKLDKAKALLSDSWSSTKNQGVKVKALGTEIKEAAEVKNAERKASKIDQNSALTDEEIHILKDAELKRTYAQDNSALKQMDKVTNSIDKQKGYKAAVKDTKATLKDSKKALKEANKSAKQGSKTTAAEALQQNADEAAEAVTKAEKALETAKTTQKENSIFGQLTAKAKDTHTGKYLSKQKAALTEGLNKKSILHPVETAKQIAETAKKGNLAEFTNALSNDGKAIITFLGDNGTYAEACKKFGYSNVAQVLEAFAGYRMADKSI